jgi:hypothetical protein
MTEHKEFGITDWSTDEDGSSSNVYNLYSEAPGWNPNRDTGYPDTDFRGFRQSFKANTGI